MFDFLKRKKNTSTSENPNSVETTDLPFNDTANKPTRFFSRLKQGLAKTRLAFTSRIATIFLGKKELNADLLHEIEIALLTADVGVETTTQLITILTQKLARKELNDAEAAFHCLKEEMKQILRTCAIPLTLPKEKQTLCHFSRRH